MVSMGYKLMDELKKNIESILDQFAKEECGNRLSQFAMIALKNLVLGEVDKATRESPKPEEKKE